MQIARRPAQTGRRRATWAIGLSLVLHVLALTGMAVGLKVMSPPPEGRAMEVRLVPLQEVMPRPTPARRSTPGIDRVQPQPAPEAPAAAPPQARAPSAPGAEARAGKGLLPGFLGRLGCDDPVAFHLTPEQRQACLDRLARVASNANAPNDDFGPLARLDPGKRAALNGVAADQAACREYKKHIPTPMPWSLRDILKKGFC